MKEDERGRASDEIDNAIKARKQQAAKHSRAALRRNEVG